MVSIKDYYWGTRANYCFEAKMLTDIDLSLLQVLSAIKKNQSHKKSIVFHSLDILHSPDLSCFANNRPISDRNTLK